MQYMLSYTPASPMLRTKLNMSSAKFIWLSMISNKSRQPDDVIKKSLKRSTQIPGHFEFKNKKLFHLTAASVSLKSRTTYSVSDFHSVLDFHCWDTLRDPHRPVHQAMLPPEIPRPLNICRYWAQNGRQPATSVQPIPTAHYGLSGMRPKQNIYDNGYAYFTHVNAEEYHNLLHSQRRNPFNFNCYFCYVIFYETYAN